ncbi:hypothetical protein GCM10007385_15000 [Tateyamaria omphalii]|uniref:hypothetical protein n=1 Tax=Tateyamaria omphalii TaxID=299262 RepID=UPI0016794E79|nr:hypothetical protein [Tateyamaria omphalii]GGX48173.1 hypothetical protein GCM10007385_15000 [Tateyamaria omphalii]
MTHTPRDRLLREIRIQATRLLKAARQGDATAIDRLNGRLKRRHALDVIARQLGGAPYVDLVSAPERTPLADPSRFFDQPMATYWNHWFRRYDEALAHRTMAGGYLFPFRQQFVVVEEHLLRALGIDPEHPDWARIAFNWARPADPAAFLRLNAVLCDAGFAEQEVTHAAQ